MKINENRPAFEIVLTLPDGTTLEGRVTVGDALGHRKTINLDAVTKVPDWALEAARTWTHPQDPVRLTANVAEGREDDARAWLKEVFPDA